MAQYRINRISEEIQKEVSDIIRNDVKDPRIAELSSVVKAEATGIYVMPKYMCVLGDEDARKSTLEGLKKLPVLLGVNWVNGWISDISLNLNLCLIIP